MAERAEGKAKKSTKLKRLIDEVITGELRRCRFDPWEIEILLDIESCKLTGSPVTRQRLLRGYLEAAHRQMEEEPVPLRLSKYVESLKAARQHKPAQERSSNGRAVSRNGSGLKRPAALAAGLTERH